MASTYTPIATTTLGSVSSSVTFSSIPSTYTDLILVSNYKLNSGTGAGVLIQFNGDTGSNYSNTFMYGSGSSAVSSRATNQTSVDAGYMSVNEWATSITSIQNYSNATTYKTTLTRNNEGTGLVAAYVNLWRNTSAISSMVVASSGWATGSTFTLYGIKAA